jgi:hypothetical protein
MLPAWCLCPLLSWYVIRQPLTTYHLLYKLVASCSSLRGALLMLDSWFTTCESTSSCVLYVLSCTNSSCLLVTRIAFDTQQLHSKSSKSQLAGRSPVTWCSPGSQMKGDSWRRCVGCQVGCDHQASWLMQACRLCSYTGASPASDATSSRVLPGNTCLWHTQNLVFVLALVILMI